MAASQPEMDAVRAQIILQYNFENIDRLVEALQAPGSGVKFINGQPILEGNKRLAILGDNVIKTVALCRWYGTTEGRARANQIMAHIGSHSALEALTRTTGLETCVSKNPGQQNEPMSPLLLRCTAAAVVAAVWVDSGYSVDATWKVMTRIGISDTTS